MTFEARDRTQITALLGAAGWIVENRDELNLDADLGAAVREVPTPSGPPTSIPLFHERNPSEAFVAARCTEMLSLVIATCPQDTNTTAC